MNRGPAVLQVYIDLSDGGFDFAVSCEICDFTPPEMNDLRAMCVVALGTMEEIWRREQGNKNPAAQAEKGEHP